MLLSTDIWVGALIRRAELAGAFAMVVRKGDPRAGAVLVKTLDRRDRTARLYAEATRGDGERVWMQPVPSDAEPELDAYIERARRIEAMVDGFEHASDAGELARLCAVPGAEARPEREIGR